MTRRLISNYKSPPDHIQDKKESEWAGCGLLAGRSITEELAAWRCEGGCVFICLFAF